MSPPEVFKARLSEALSSLGYRKVGRQGVGSG